jgi:aromatic-L-amino-acid decarboxylase
MRHVLAGCEHADSIVVNPHKWLMTPIDCSAFYVRDVDILKQTFSLVPDYLKTAENDVTNYMDWGIQLGRRFRALKLWMVIRYFGHEGLAEIIRGQLQTAQKIARQIDAHPDFVRVAPTPFTTLCFRCIPADLAARLKDATPDAVERSESYLEWLNDAIMQTVNGTGEAFMAPTRLDGRFVWRMAIGNIGSDEAYVSRIWDLIQQIAARLDPENRHRL